MRTVAAPLSIGISGITRQFKVDAFAPPPTQRSNSVSGWGVSIDALIPVIPAVDANDRRNRLTLTGSFVTGSGIADLLTTGGGAQFPTLPNSMQQSPPPQYTPDVDNGLVTFDQQTAILHTINWRAFKVGLQYYLPPLNGRLIFAANYTYSHSDNMAELFRAGARRSSSWGRSPTPRTTPTPTCSSTRRPPSALASPASTRRSHYLANGSNGASGDKPHNIRGMGQAVYVF